jgi:hypothetical protein
MLEVPWFSPGQSYVIVVCKLLECAKMRHRGDFSFNPA